MLGPTGQYRAYYDRIPEDVLQPLDDSAWEAEVVAVARRALSTAELPRFAPVHEALAATRALRAVVAPFLSDYATELDDDPLPSLWER
jgi:hypothetical protein